MRDLTFTLAELRDLELRSPFSLVVCLTLSMLHFFIADKVTTAALFHNFQNIFPMLDTKGATEIGFHIFNLENILFSLALETRSVNNYFTDTKKIWKHIIKLKDLFVA